MNDKARHLIQPCSTVKEALVRLDELSKDAVLFLVDGNNTLLGSITDGDIRRGLIKNLTLDHALTDFVQPNPKRLSERNHSLIELIKLRDQNFRIFPVVNESSQIVNIINLRKLKSYIPADAVLMAGGRGERLRPLTDDTPKPMLKVGNKPILEHNLIRIRDYGIVNTWITVNYLAEQITDYFTDGGRFDLNIKYVRESVPMGTAGSLSLVTDFRHDVILLMNSDLMTTINLEEFFLFFINSSADMAVACIPYSINIPYAVMETMGDNVIGLKEKPTYTHHCNAGIYLLKREALHYIPKNTFCNATDLMEVLIENQKSVVAYPMVEYWLDIGKPDDFIKAQSDIKHIQP